MITDAIYEIALTLLRDRYENKRCIVQAHFKVTWSQPSMKCESGLGLRKSLETTNEHLRALEEPTHEWNSFLIFWITEKLYNESKKQWNDLESHFQYFSTTFPPSGYQPLPWQRIN